MSAIKEKVIGILGGMGPEATLYLFDRIIRNTPASSDQDHLRIIIDNNPKIPDRTAAIIGNGVDPVPKMVQSGLSLERAGADFIVIPCISAHFFLDRLQHELNLHVLSAIDETVDLIVKELPYVNTVGLLATSGTLKGGLFQKRLKASGIETLVPGQEDQENVMSAIYRIKGDPAGWVRADSKERLIIIAGRLMDQGAQGVIAGCTEIPLALSREDLSVPLLDPVEILAGAAVREARQTTNPAIDACMER